MTAELIEKVRRQRPQVVDLACALALTPSVHVTLVRALRLARFPDSGVSLEADLWASPLVHTRSGPMIVLRTDVQAVFRDVLRANRSELDRCYAALTASRSAGRPLQTLEDRLTYAILAGDSSATEDILMSVVKTMVDEPARRSDLAAWSARVIARFQSDLRESEGAKLLASVAAGWVATPTVLAAMVPAPESARLAARLHPDAPKTSVSIRRVGDTLEVGKVKAPSVSLEMPTANPLLIVDEDRICRIDPRAVTRIDVTSREVMIGTSDGKRWLLGPKQDTPNLAAITSSFGGGGQTAAYLVTPTLAVTSAPSIVTDRVLTFGGRQLEARVVAIDVDSDIAILRLSSAASVPPLELDDEPHAGQSFRIYGLPQGSATETGRPASPAHRVWEGTLAAVSPSLTLRLPYDEVPDALNRPGMPVFVGTRVIGHLDGQRRSNFLLRATSARSIRQWIERAETTRPVQPMSLVIRAATQAIADEAKIALGSMTIPGWQIWVEYAAEGVVTEDDLRLAVSARGRTPGGRSMVIGIGVTQDKDVTGYADEKMLVVRIVGSVGEAVDAVEGHLGLSRRESTPDSLLPRVWLSSSSIESVDAPTELSFVGAADAQPNELAVLFSTRQGRPHPLGLYRVTGGRRFSGGGDGTQPTSSELNGVRVLSFVPVTDDAARSELASLASTTSTRDTRNLNIHDRLVELLLACTRPEAVPVLLSYLGVPVRLAARRKAQIEILLPEPVPLDGLLGAVIEQRNDQSIVRRYVWYEHAVTVRVGEGSPESPPPVGLSRTIALGRGVGGALYVNVKRNEGDDPVFDKALTEILNGLPAVSPLSTGAILRRGIAAITAALAASDDPTLERYELFVRYPGIGRSDLAELQARVLEREPTVAFKVVSFDPETDIVEFTFFGDSEAQILRFAKAVGYESKENYLYQRAGDAVAHEFGTSPWRGHRKMLATIANDYAQIEVSADGAGPVRGYVAFYWTNEGNRIVSSRVRAADGVASLTLERRVRGYAVGAFVEDEGLMLECYVD
jgi:hypothetical protein